MLAKTIKKLFRTFGGPVIIYSTSVPPFSGNSYGFLQPLRYKNKMYVDAQLDELGLDDDGRYVYIGLPDRLLTDSASNGRQIDVNNQMYSVIRAENVYYKNEAIYVWAIIKRNRGGMYL